MTPQADRFAVIRLTASQLQHPELLTGLDLWLQLGLLSQTQVKQFCRLHLSCALPVREFSQISDRASVHSETEPARQDVASLPTAANIAPLDTSAVNRSTSWIGRTLQSLMAEIGVIWLLCLGVFMVVVSSGVLAANQWRNVSPIGQYGILLTYTLAFWGVSQWTGRRAALRLTTRMLQTATLLIIPVNFWMMDGLALWQSGLGVGLNLLAALMLSAITILLIPQLASNATQQRLAVINSLGLSWLHWGWAIAGIPIIATYIGTIGTALLTYLHVKNRRSPNLFDPQADHQNRSPYFLITLIIALSVLLLLGRAILGAQVPLDRLGLAFGICGWLFCWFTRRHAIQSREETPESVASGSNPLLNFWTTVGIVLLLIGWSVTVAANPPWQAVAVSGLGLWLLGERLGQRDTPRQLMALVLVGLQTYGLLWRLLPMNLRQAILATADQWLGTAGTPWVLLGVAGFPYLWLMLALANRLRQRQVNLARLTERLALALGIVLALFSWLNPLVWAINLTLAAATLTLTLRPRTISTAWLYINHLLILVALASWINAYFPDLPLIAWAKLLLLGMAIEWGLSLAAENRWNQSCWHLGLGLASVSYVLLPNWYTLSDSDRQNLIWLVVPALLTGMARLRRPQLAAWLSAATLVAQFYLLNSLDSWLLALGAAVGLMLINTLTLEHIAAALLTLGFGLGFEAVLLYRFFPDLLRFDTGMLILAANLWLLWLAQDGLRHRSQLGQLYASACNTWAVGIALFSLISLSLRSFVAYSFLASWSLSLELVISSGLMALAIVYWLWRQGASEVGFLGLAWAVELVAVTLIGWQNGSIAALAIVTVALGLVSQLAGDVWVSRSRQTYRPSWHWIPLLYAGFGALIGHHRFTATTGLYTLAAALVGIGVGRRVAAFKPITLGSCLLVSVAFYELLIYQLMQATGSHAGDGITLLASLATLIALGERLGQRWLLPYLRLQRPQFIWLAHLHWGIGSSLALVAVWGLSDTGFLLWLLVSTLLTGYGLAHGRRSSELLAEGWTYIGILQVLGIIAYVLYRLLPHTLLLAWAGSLAALVALGLYFLPWRAWGWSQRPWCNVAMGLPGVVVVLTANQITLQSLLIVAAFYAWIAKAERRLRLSYLSVALFDWAAFRFLTTEGWLNLPWISALITGSLLYIAQIDPALRSAPAREQRHWLRSLAVGLLSLTLFYQAELEPDPTALLIRLLTLGLAVGLLFLGLVLRIRAFLYVGTATFVLQVLRLLWLFINNYSLLLWAIGIVIGLLFIWIAATFEARRSQMNALMQYWLNEFTQWE